MKMIKTNAFCLKLFSKTVLKAIRPLFLPVILLPLTASAQKYTNKEIARFVTEAKAVTIIRDNWGIPHFYGKTDADAVFGLMYAEGEDNFRGIEQNYLYQFGKLTEADGEKSLASAITLQLVADTAAAIKDYKAAQPWFKKLMDVFADGLNYYLYTHPNVKPLVFQHF